VSPREDLSKANLPPADLARLKRQEAAHKNALENFPLFAAAMIVGNEAGLEAGTLNLVGVGYLVCRGVYSWLYVNTTSEKKSYARYVCPGCLCWGVRSCCCCGERSMEMLIVGLRSGGWGISCASIH
jgi:uncharacterized MAPEG superfamily protein